MFRLKLIPHGTKFRFMRARFLGLGVSAFLSILSVVLFIHPGLNYGIDFAGGIVIETRTPEATDLAKMRETVHGVSPGETSLQQFGSATDTLVRVSLPKEGGEEAQGKLVNKVKATLTEKFPGIQFRRVEVVGPKVSGELVEAGFMAVGLALAAVMAYIWFRFEWQFGVGAVVTLILDVTKAVGFFALTQLEFSLTSVAALLTIIGYSINDKVVVYDRMRENLRKYKSLDLRSLIDQSINETLARCIYTSFATFLSVLPLAFLGSDTVRVFAMTMMFGIVVGTTSSIYIAAPLLLLLGEGRLRRSPPPAEKKPTEPAPAGARP